MALVRAVALSALSTVLYGCGGDSNGPAKLCCIQCGPSVGEQQLHCRPASYDTEADAESCDMDDIGGLSGEDLTECDGQKDWYEHVGAKDMAGPKAYGPAAAKFWQHGNYAKERRHTYAYYKANPDCHASWRNNSELSADEIVQNHREHLAAQGHLVAVRGVLHHPLDEKLQVNYDFLGAVVNLLEKALEKIVDACTSSTEDIEKCLGFIGLAVVVAEAPQQQIFAVSTNHSEAVFAQLAAALQEQTVKVI